MMNKVTKGASLATAIVSVFFLGCAEVAPDYSAYSNTNLMPNNQFGSLVAPVWTLDSASFGTYQLVSDSAGANAIGDGWGGWTSEILLRTGAPLLAGSVKPNVYRLEVKNLIADGDFQVGNPLTLGTTGTLVPVASTTLISTAGNQELNINISPTESAYALLTGFPTYTSNTYSLSFRYNISVLGHLFAGFDTNFTGLSAGRDKTSLSDINNTSDGSGSFAGNSYRYPFASHLIGGTVKSFSPSGGKNYLVLNSQTEPFGTGYSAWTGKIDDLQLVANNIDAGIRINIPKKEAGRPDLLAGGVYTLKLWVRNDHTPKTSNISGYSVGTVNNRFNADFISVSIHGDQSLTTTHGNSEVVYSRGLSTESSWKNQGINAFETWTQLSFNFTNLMQGPSASNGLQIVISATNIGSALRTAGSILITKPELFWSPN